MEFHSLSLVVCHTGANRLFDFESMKSEPLRCSPAQPRDAINRNAAEFETLEKRSALSSKHVYSVLEKP